MNELPAGWRWESIDELAADGTFVDGDWVETKDQDPQGDVRLTQLADVGVAEFRDRSDRWMRADQAERLGCSYLRPDDILIARMPEPLGRACMVPSTIGRAVTAVDVAILRLGRADLLPRYVMWALNAPRSHGQVMAMQSGTTRKRISRRNLGTVHLPIPPLGEQRRIVEILEDHLSRLDAADRALERGLRRLSLLTSTERRRMFSELANEHGLTPLLDVAAIANGQTPKGVLELVVSEAAPGLLPFFKVGDMNTGDGRWMQVARSYISPVDASSVGLTPRPAGTVLLPKRGGAIATNKKRLLRNPGCYDLNTMGIVPRDRLDPLYLWHWLITVDLATIADGSNVPQINAPQIRGLALPTPSLDDQRVVVGELDRLDQATGATTDAAAIGLRRNQQLRRSLLGAAFAGQLGRSASPAISEECVNV